MIKSAAIYIHKRFDGGSLSPRSVESRGWHRKSKSEEEASIPQARVEGITDRQLRRIEQGECRATLSALRDLAKAHGLDVNAYMEKVANAMS